MSSERILESFARPITIAVKYLHRAESAARRFTILSTYRIESTLFHCFYIELYRTPFTSHSACSGYWTTPSIYSSILPSLLCIRIKVNESVPVTLLLSIVNSTVHERIDLSFKNGHRSFTLLQLFFSASFFLSPNMLLCLPVLRDYTDRKKRSVFKVDAFIYDNVIQSNNVQLLVVFLPPFPFYEYRSCGERRNK